MKKHKFDVNWNIFGCIEIKAEDSEKAKEKFENLSFEEKVKIVLNEINNSGIDIGTVESIN